MNKKPEFYFELSINELIILKYKTGEFPALKKGICGK